MITIESSDVFHGDFAMAPHGADDGVKLLSFEASESHAHVLAVDDERQRPFVHVQHHCNSNNNNNNENNENDEMMKMK